MNLWIHSIRGETFIIRMIESNIYAKVAIEPIIVIPSTMRNS